MTIRCSRYFLDCTSRQSNKFLTVWNTRVDTERMNLTLERLPGRWGSIEVMDTTNRMHLSWVICRVSCNFSEIFIYSLKILYICTLIISTSLSPNFPQEPISTSCFPPFYFCFNLLSDQSIKESDSLFPQLKTTENSSASSEAFEALLLGLAFVTGLMLPVQFHITRSLTKLSCHVLQQQKHRECLKVTFHVIFKVLGWVERWTGQKRGESCRCRWSEGYFHQRTQEGWLAGTAMLWKCEASIVTGKDNL